MQHLLVNGFRYPSNPAALFLYTRLFKRMSCVQDFTTDATLMSLEDVLYINIGCEAKVDRNRVYNQKSDLLQIVTGQINMN